MANINAPKGAVPVKHLNGSPWNGQVNLYYIPASDGTPVFVGDFVKSLTNAADANGVPAVIQSTAGANHRGSVVGFVPDPANPLQDPNYRRASTARYCWVADSPDTIFEIQENGTMGIGAPGRNVEVTVGAGSTSTGMSGMQLNSSTLATTNTLSLRVLQAVAREDNAPASANAKWQVMINLHELTQTTGV